MRSTAHELCSLKPSTFQYPIFKESSLFVAVAGLVDLALTDKYESRGILFNLPKKKNLYVDIFITFESFCFIYMNIEILF